MLLWLALLVFHCHSHPLSHQSGGDEHIVLLAHNATFGTRHEHAASVLDRLSLTPEHPDVRHVYNNSAFHGFSASMKSHCLDALVTMADVIHLEKAVRISSRTDQTRSSSPWGLERISTASNISGDPRAMSFTYSYSNLGSGVDIYVVDTGINTEHVVFGGRARTGFSFEKDISDGDGHGTHVGGTAGGAVFGVASDANVIAVKVLGNDGSGSSSDTISGMDFVINQHDQRKGQAGFIGSIMSMSWGLSETSSAVNTAVQQAAEAGIAISLAAGNSADDACKYSPSNTGGVGSDSIVTVGSVGITGRISSFSNTGKCVDIYAPGENVLSAWKDSPVTVNFLSGTSMACPAVSGVMASLMAANASLAASPRALKQALLSMALSDQIQGDTKGGRALLLSNGISTQR